MRRALSRRRSLKGNVASTVEVAAASRFVLLNRVGRCDEAYMRVCSSKQPFTLELTIVHARGLKKADLLNPDPYARVFIDNEFVGQTNIISRTTAPVWNYRFKIPLLHPHVVLK